MTKVYLLYEREGIGFELDRMLCIYGSLEAAKLAAEKWEIHKYNNLKAYGEEPSEVKPLEWEPPEKSGGYFNLEFINDVCHIHESNAGVFIEEWTVME